MSDYKHTQTTVKHHIIKNLCKAVNITQSDLCRILNISITQLDRIKRNYVKDLPISKLYSMASVLGISSIELLYALERNKLYSKDVVLSSIRNVLKE